jgi:hypothetical protein
LNCEVGTPVKNCAPFALLLTLSLSSCEILLPPKPVPYGADDYAIGEAEPYPREVQLAKLRLRSFVRRANSQQRLALDRNPYVAIQANEIEAGEDWQLLRELSSGQVRATSLYASDFRNRSAFGVKFLLIFNARTGRLLRPIGVLAADTPLRGAVGEFAGIRAIYGGTGWW